jgi:hypothetical protein
MLSSSVFLGGWLRWLVRSGGGGAVRRGLDAGSNYPAQLAMPMGQEPTADCHSDAAQNQQLIADYQAGQDHEGQAAEH